MGFPAPTVFWYHAGRDIAEDSLFFKSNSTTVEGSQGESGTTTSYLNVLSANTSLNGEVSCNAHPPPSEEIGGLRLHSVKTSTELSVLGKYMIRFSCD